jgi:DNA-binding transcriptional LysR family regulator
MDWDKLKIFHAVAESGNFTKATYVLNLSQSAISRQIQSLEQELKTQLFERHARGLSLTENGEYLFKTAREVISKLKDVESTLMDKKDKPSGKLTVTTVVSFGTTWLTPRIQEFMKLNPEMEIELIFDDKELDLSIRQADIGIWMRRPKQLNHIQKKLIDIHYHIYGSTKYLEQYGHPKIISELNKHKFISYGKGAPSPVFNPDWALKLGVKDNKKRKPVMKVNSIYGLLLAVQSGVGLAALPDYITIFGTDIVM